MDIKDRALRILMEQDLWGIGEADTFNERNYRFTVTRIESGWEWKVEVNPDAVPHGVATHKFATASRLFRAMFEYLHIQW